MREISMAVLFVANVAVSVSAQEALASRTSNPLMPDEETFIPEELTLERALEILRERNPLLVAERQRLAAAEGDLQQARTYPNPFFSLETESFSRVGGDPEQQEIFLAIEQPILLGGKRGRRIDVADALVGAAANDVQAFERNLSFRLKTVYAALARSQSDLDLANQILEDFDQVIRLTRIRYERGELSGGELRRVETERLRFLEQQVAAEIALENARAELLGLFGMPSYSRPFRVMAPPRYGGDLADVEALMQDAVTSRPEVLAQLQRREAARSNVAFQKAFRVPDVVPFIGFQRSRDNVLDLRTSFINFGFSVGIPIFDRNQGNVSRARAELRREESFEQAVRYQVAVEVRQAYEAYRAQRRLLELFETTYIRTSRQARDIVEAAYRMGGETLINFLDASRVYNETLRAYNRAVFDTSAARFRLELALGRELS